MFHNNVWLMSRMEVETHCQSNMLLMSCKRINIMKTHLHFDILWKSCKFQWISLNFNSFSIFGLAFGEKFILKRMNEWPYWLLFVPSPHEFFLFLKKLQLGTLPTPLNRISQIYKKNCHFFCVAHFLNWPRAFGLTGTVTVHFCK